MSECTFKISACLNVQPRSLIADNILSIISDLQLYCPYPHLVGDDELRVAYQSEFSMKESLLFDIPASAQRCVILIPHGQLEPAHTMRQSPLTAEAEMQVKRTKRATALLINRMVTHFGEPSVVCGQNPATIMTAVYATQHNYSTTQLLDAPDSMNQTKKRARRLMRDNMRKPLVVAYGSEAILRKLVAGNQPELAECRALKPGIDAAVVFMGQHGKLISAKKLALLAI